MNNLFNKIKTDNIIFLLILIAVISLIPHLTDNTITQGQIGKQVFQAEQAKSYFNGEIEGYLPLRHFLEMHHDKIIPWGSEFPLYSLCVAGISKISGIPLIISGRLLSFLLFIFTLYIAYKVGLFFDRDKKIYLFLPLCIALYPVFRLYSISFMPDLAMTAFCFWGLYLSLKKRFVLAALSLCIATLFKYYAVFITFGIMLLILFSRNENKKFKNLFFLALTPLPAILFLVYMFTYDIPNPITEYNKYFDSGHMSSIKGYLNPKIYFRALSWIFIKNPTVLGTLLIFTGLFAALKKNILGEFEEKRIFKLIGYLAISFIFFIIIFGSAFYVHDYYGLQIGLATSILAALGLSFIMSATMSSKKLYLLVPAVSLVFLIMSIITTNSNLIKQSYYLSASEKVKIWTAPKEKILVITDLVTPSIPFYSSRMAWMLNIDYWKVYEKEIEKKLTSTNLDSVIVFVRKGSNLSSSTILERIAAFGWNHISDKASFPSTHRKIPETHIFHVKKKN